MQLGMSLLFYLSPDKTNIDDITRYLCNTVTSKNRAKIRQMICQLRKNGWDIECKTYSISEQQYHLVQTFYRDPVLYGRISMRAKLTPDYLQTILRKDESNTDNISNRQCKKLYSVSK